jgi:dynein heavy chain
MRYQKALSSNPVLEELKDLVFSFKDTMPVVLALRNRNLKTYHWNSIKEVIGREFEITEMFRLKNLMDLEVVEHQELILEISTQAT